MRTCAAQRYLLNSGDKGVVDGLAVDVVDVADVRENVRHFAVVGDGRGECWQLERSCNQRP